VINRRQSNGLSSEAVGAFGGIFKVESVLAVLKADGVEAD
jgi:hypothetical protein